MSLNVAHHLPTKPSEPSASADSLRRPKRQPAGGRKSKQQRDNIENAPSPTLPTASLANLPIQKQSTKIRKRLLTDNLPNPCTNDHLSTKRHKVLLEDPSIQNVTPLHRTLSDKSSYLNQASTSDISTDRKDSPSKAQSALPSWRKESQLKRSGSESDDADDEDDANAVRSGAKDQVLSTNSKASETDATSIQTTDGPPLGLINVEFESSPTNNLSLRSRDDDPFGSDTTLTSPEDDSEDEPESDRSIVEGSPQPPAVPQPEATPEVIPSQIIPAPETSPVKRKPGRPRKNPLPSSPVSPMLRTRHEKSGNDTLASLPQAPFIKNSQKASSIKSLRLSTSTKQSASKTAGSLMARIIEGKRLSGDNNDAELSDSSDDTDLISFANFSVKNSCDDQIESKACLTPKVEQGSVTTNSITPTPISTEPLLVGARSPSKPKDYVFATPTLPLPRSIHATRSGGSRPTPLKSTLTHSASERHTIGKQNYPRSTLRNIPRPRLFQTCLDIMTQSEPSPHRSNVQTIKLILKHALEQGMRKVRESTELKEQVLNKVPKVDTSSLQIQAWSCVIGNGKGLFPGSTRKQEEQQRVNERQTIVAEAYRSLKLPPPPENWDKSSKVLAAGLSFGSSPSSNAADDGNAQRWSNVMDDALDHLSRRHGCEYCRKTYRNRNGLMYHMERCTMAQLQTSISTDLDGDSTASETEDQRKARCPKPSGRETNRNVNEAANVEDEDEEGIIMCVCGSKEDEGAMVQCDDCKVWLHIDCLDLTEEEIPEEYFCPPCMGQPTPSTGGKSFRHIPKSAKRKSEDRKVGRPRHRSRSEDSLEYNNKGSVSSRLGFSHGSESDSDEADSMATDDDSEPSAEGLISPQVVLNHNWEQGSGDAANDLGYDPEYMNSLFGARTIFRQSRAPALMLDGSSSQESQAELSNPLLSSDPGFNDENGDVFHAIASTDLSGMALEIGTETEMSFPESQPFDYIPSSTGSLFQPEYGASDRGTPDQLLASEDTIDSDGLRTPIDLQHGASHIDLWVTHDLESFVEETAAVFDLDCSQSMMAELKNDQYSAVNMADWFNEDATHHDDFDLNVLIDLEAVSLSDK
ncbi:hypothetical protein BGZ80_002172 [Entomortierella chlamydospora]|uniref:PHD-type domain-containing protein n=1 Tax=Entomortierella chlamydospora TaxID=101097 RepID=A0A9P6MPV0_9FUNG|nr:hypothetical protein BGZ79_001339 [Entomortierella chlamydospora]KAG0009669.1 hypothetical protein BGZ80_002172 [Entomortierella chlamydospora]